MPLVLLVRKKTLACHITRYVTRQFHSITRFGTGIASGEPELQTLGQQKLLDWNTVGPALMNDSGGTQMAVYTPNQVPAYIVYRASPQNIQEAFSRC